MNPLQGLVVCVTGSLLSVMFTDDDQAMTVFQGTGDQAVAWARALDDKVTQYVSQMEAT